MVDFEKAHEDALELLKSIKTLDDLEKHKDEILDLVIGALRFSLDVLKDMLTGSAAPEEIEAKFENLQDGKENIQAELDKEFERISAIPGAKDYVLSLQGELTGRMGALASEMSMVMAEVMNKLMGGIMGDAVGEMMEDTTYELPEGETIEALEFINSIKTLDDLKEKNEEIFIQIENMYKAELETARELKNSELLAEELREKANTLRNRQIYLANEIEKCFEKVESIPGGEEYIESLEGLEPEKIFTNRIEPIVEELRQVLDELSMNQDGIDMFGSSSDFDSEKEELEELTFFNYIDTFEQLKEYRDDYISSVENIIRDDMDLLEAIRDDFYEPAEIPGKLNEVGARYQVIEKELEIGFAKLAKLPDAEQYVKSYKDEMLEKIKPKMKEVQDFLTQLKKDKS